jgi:ABC-2 type transport system permease protein
MKFLPLVENEVLKLWKRRRFRLVLAILIALIGIIVFAQVEGRRRFHTKDWRIDTQEQVSRIRNWLRQGRLPDTQRRWVQFEIARLQYHLDRNLNPEDTSGPLFSRGFASASSYLLLPLLAIVFAADIVSSEFSEGTVKLLLTRPIGRRRVLASKLVALLLAVGLTVLVGGIVAYLFGGLAYGYRGWGAPFLTGFRMTAAEALDSSAVRAVPLWQDAVLSFGLAWFAAAAVAVIGFMTSVLLRSTAASMGTMFAALILGTILPRLASTWEFQKYLFVTNLPLPDYATGTPPPIPGMTVPFSVVVLAVWAAAALVVSFEVFARRDVLA